MYINIVFFLIPRWCWESFYSAYTTGVAELRVKDTAQPPFLIPRGGKKEGVVLTVSLLDIF